MQKRTVLLSIALVVTLLVAATPGPAAYGSAPLPPSGFKQLAGPPQDIIAGSMQIPDPAQTGIRSHSAMLPVRFTATPDGNRMWEQTIPVDQAEGLSMVLLAPGSKDWTIGVQPDGGRMMTAAEAQTDLGLTIRDTQFGLDDNMFPAQSLSFERATPGQWKVRLTAPGTLEQAGAKPDGYLIVGSDSPYRLFAHLTTHELVSGRPVGLAAYAYDNNQPSEGRVPAVARLITQATARVQMPDGREIVLPMLDDGRHADGAAGDGVYGMLLPQAIPGMYTAQVEMQGVTPGGAEFVRTTQHLFPVIESRFALSGKARAAMADANRLQIDLLAGAARSLETVQVYAEVWGTNGMGVEIPVAWVGGMVTPKTDISGAVVPVMLDTRWIGRAAARAPFTLHNVRVQDPDTHIAFATAARIPFSTPRLPLTAMRQSEITSDMLMGPRPAEAAIQPEAYVGGHKLLLVHGYCSGNAWPTTNFTNYAVFADYHQNRTHDQFAQLVRDFGAQFDSFGTVAHSQGGPATLHLYTYYWSGLDSSTGSRLLQSVGSPYQGTALAGNIALLGSIFGVGCGANYDLTYDGAAAWLAGIPTWARSRVHYWTTSDTEVWWRWDYCNAASDPILDDPEDGVVEQWSGQLGSAVNHGHKEGWCHTSGMRDPAQTTDSSRNIDMNTYANR